MNAFRILAGRALALSALALSAAAGGAGAQTLPPARQVIDRYVEAIGGKRAAAAHQSRRMVAEMSMPAMGMTMTMEILAARPNKMLSKMEMPGMGQLTQGYDGQVAWSVNPVQGPRLLEGSELAQTVRQADFDAGTDPAKNFPTMETVERAEMAGRPCWKVRMVSRDGDEIFSCFDTETGLQVGAQMKQQSAMGVMEATMTFADYQDFGGVKIPTKTTTSVAGQEMVMTVKSITYNDVPASVFELPAEIKALRQQQQ